MFDVLSLYPVTEISKYYTRSTGRPVFFGKLVQKILGQRNFSLHKLRSPGKPQKHDDHTMIITYIMENMVIMP